MKERLMIVVLEIPLVDSVQKAEQIQSREGY